MERSDRLRTVIEKYMKRPEQSQSAPQIPAAPLTMTDRELIDKAMNAANGSRFSALWNGDTAAGMMAAFAAQAKGF